MLREQDELKLSGGGEPSNKKRGLLSCFARGRESVEQSTHEIGCFCGCRTLPREIAVFEEERAGIYEEDGKLD
jgi:hypothetical protein